MSPINPLNAGGFQLPMNPNSTMNPGTPVQNGSAPGAGSSDPYTMFNQQLMEILKSAQGTGSNAPLYAAKDELNNEALNLSNPLASTPYSQLFKGMAPNAVAPAMAGTAAAFSPGITSINSQIQSNNDANTKFNEMANTAETIAGNFKPIPLSEGQSLVSPNSGQVILQGTTYNTNPDPLHPGQFILTPQNSLSAPGGAGAGTGVGTNWSAYNGGVDPDYTKKMNNTLSTLKIQMPNGFDPMAADAIFKAHRSPLTSHMVGLAASTYGVDPTALMANIALESVYGTSNVATEDNNPGGIIWAHQPGAVQGTPRPPAEGGYYAKFDNMQDGLYEQARLISKNTNSSGQSQVPTGSNPQSTPSAPMSADPQGNVFSPAYSSRVQKLTSVAPILAPYVTAGPGGVAFLAGNRAAAGAPGLGNLANLPQVTSTGLPIDTDGGLAQQLDGINAIAQQQQTMKTLIQNALSSGGGNASFSHLSNILTAGLNTFAQNDQQMTALTAYTSSVLAAASEIKNLVGGAGSGVRITGFEITNQQAQMPQATDSYQQAMTKLDAMNTRLAQALHTVFPDYNVNYAVLPQSQEPGMFTYGGGSTGGAAAGGNVVMTGPGGTFTVPQSQVSIMQQNGYK